jgi:hypothetical protein
MGAHGSRKSGHLTFHYRVQVLQRRMTVFQEAGMAKTESWVAILAIGLLASVR